MVLVLLVSIHLRCVWMIFLGISFHHFVASHAANCFYSGNCFEIRPLAGVKNALGGRVIYCQVAVRSPFEVVIVETTQ